MDQLFGNMFKTLSDQTAAMQQSFNQMNIHLGHDYESEEEDEEAVDTLSRSTVAPKFEPFDKRRESWENYLQRFNQHLTIYDITLDEKKRACLLSWAGPETYALLRNLFGSTDLQTQTFDALTGKLTEHFQVSGKAQRERGLPFMGMGFGGGMQFTEMTTEGMHQRNMTSSGRSHAQYDAGISYERDLQHHDMMSSGRGIHHNDMISSRGQHHNNMMTSRTDSSSVAPKKVQYQGEVVSERSAQYDDEESGESQSQLSAYSLLEAAEDLSGTLESILEQYRLKGKDKLKIEIKCMTQIWYDGLGPQQRFIVTVANPLKYAWELHEAYFKKEPIRTKVLFVCMNPTRDSQTGIPFYEEKAMKEIFNNVNEMRMRRGINSTYLMGWDTDSGKNFWKFMKAKFGSTEAFFEHCFAIHYCPLLFLNKANGHVFLDGFKKLRNPLLNRIMEQCDNTLMKIIKTVKPKLVIGVGEFAFDRVEEATRKVERELGIRIAKTQIIHPSSNATPTYGQWSKKTDAVLGKSTVWKGVISER